jgi:hypothetical protein
VYGIFFGMFLWWLALPAQAGAITQTLANALGGWRTQDLKTLRVMPDPDCIADATVTDKTTCDTAVLLVGKMQIVAPGMCFPLDTNKAKTKDSYRVTPSSATSTSRPIYRTAYYLARRRIKPNRQRAERHAVHGSAHHREQAVPHGHRQQRDGHGDVRIGRREGLARQA